MHRNVGRAALAACLAFVLFVSPAAAQQRQPQPIRDAAAKAVENTAETLAAQPAGRGGKGKLFWPGVVLGIAGVTTAVLGATVYRVEDKSAGHSPDSTYQACVALKTSNPAYAGNDCNALKGRNDRLLWSGVALGGVGAVMTIGSARSGAALGPGRLAFVHRVSF